MANYVTSIYRWHLSSFSYYDEIEEAPCLIIQYVYIIGGYFHQFVNNLANICLRKKYKNNKFIKLNNLTKGWISHNANPLGIYQGPYIFLTSFCQVPIVE